MKVISTNTGILELVDVGMYQGFCSPDWLIHDDLIQQNFEEDVKDGEVGVSPEQYWDRFSFDKYKDWVFKKASEYIEDVVLPEAKNTPFGIISITPKSIWSPREYNFDTDRLVFELEVEDDIQDRIEHYLTWECTEDVRDEFRNHLKINFTSVSGFVSFIPNNITTFLQDLHTDDRCICVFLQWYFYENLDCYATLNPMDDWNDWISEQEIDYYSFLN